MFYLLGSFSDYLAFLSRAIGKAHVQTVDGALGSVLANVGGERLFRLRVEGNRRNDLISTACPIWWEMNVVIYMPKRQQGIELNEQGVKPRHRTGLGMR
jgi:hypothetical protein